MGNITLSNSKFFGNPGDIFKTEITKYASILNGNVYILEDVNGNVILCSLRDVSNGLIELTSGALFMKGKIRSNYKRKDGSKITWVTNSTLYFYEEDME